nr:DegV family protein [Aerococcus sanguinicola]
MRKGRKYMSKIAILCDSLAYLDPAFKEEHDIFVVPLSVTFSDGTYRDMVDIDDKSFYAKVEASGEFPKSSQPSPGAFMEAFDEIQAKGYDQVLAIMVTPRASGTFETLKMAAAQEEDLEVYPFNSQIGLQAQGYYIEAAVKERDQGRSVEEIIANLDKLPPYSKLYVILDDVRYVLKGGRLGSAATALVNFLKIKPIVKVGQDRLELSARTRSLKKAIQRVVESLEEDAAKGLPLRATISGRKDFEPYQSLKAIVQEKFPDMRLDEGIIGPTVGVHSGPNAFALMWSIDTDKLSLDDL